jgi:hypothetical protein
MSIDLKIQSLLNANKGNNIKILKINNINISGEYRYTVNKCFICHKDIIPETRRDNIVKGLCGHIYHLLCIKNIGNVCPQDNTIFQTVKILDNNILYKKI